MADNIDDHSRQTSCSHKQSQSAAKTHQHVKVVKGRRMSSVTLAGPARSVRTTDEGWTKVRTYDIASVDDLPNLTIDQREGLRRVWASDVERREHLTNAEKEKASRGAVPPDMQLPYGNEDMTLERKMRLADGALSYGTREGARVVYGPFDTMGVGESLSPSIKNDNRQNEGGYNVLESLYLRKNSVLRTDHLSSKCLYQAGIDYAELYNRSGVRNLKATDPTAIHVDEGVRDFGWIGEGPGRMRFEAARAKMTADQAAIVDAVVLHDKPISGVTHLVDRHGSPRTLRNHAQKLLVEGLSLLHHHFNPPTGDELSGVVSWSVGGPDRKTEK